MVKEEEDEEERDISVSTFKFIFWFGGETEGGGGGGNGGGGNGGICGGSMVGRWAVLFGTSILCTCFSDVVAVRLVSAD